MSERTFTIKASELAALFAGVQAYVNNIEAALKPLGIVTALSKQLASDWDKFNKSLVESETKSEVKPDGA